MYKAPHRIIHIIKGVIDTIPNIDINTRSSLFISLNKYAIDALKQNEKIENRIDDLEYELKIIKDNIKYNIKQSINNNEKK